MEIKEACKILKLSYLRESYEDLIEESSNLNLSNEDFLNLFLEREVEKRKNNGIARRIRKTKFINKKFIDNKENIIMIGTPGCGKTHYATALGIKACMKGKNVLFTSVPNLVIELQEAMSKNQITNYKRKFEKYDLVILDELGYVSFDKTGCKILFNLLSSHQEMIRDQ